MQNQVWRSFKICGAQKLETGHYNFYILANFYLAQSKTGLLDNWLRIS